jgi:hypothetical protein
MQMPDDNLDRDREIIYTAYADRVREAFRVFAENLTMGENERSSRERFQRAVEQTRKARDLALEAIAGGPTAEPAPSLPADGERQEAPAAADGLSDEERALIEQALSGTTGQRAPVPSPSATARSPLMRR